MFVLVNAHPIFKIGRTRKHLEETTMELDVDVFHNFKSILHGVSLLIIICIIP
jgi:hypothetical protein